MTITDFLNSLTIFHDTTTDTTVLKVVVGVIAIILAAAGLLFILHAVRYLYNYGFEGTALAGVISGLFMCTFFVLAAIWYFTLPALSLQWIISTDNIDPLTLYAYFNVNSAPINGTAEIVPKGEFYQEVLAWYTTNFPR